jgi:hypothetical protein
MDVEMKNINQNLCASKRTFVKELYNNFIIFKVENKNMILKVMFGIYLICGIVLSGFISNKAYVYMNNNTYNKVEVKQVNKPAWQKAIDISDPNAMMYRVDLNNNDKILEKLSYIECISRDDVNAWYCPTDLYNEEIEHLNNKDSNINSVIPTTPYVSHVSKIQKKDYID